MEPASSRGQRRERGSEQQRWQQQPQQRQRIHRRAALHRQVGRWPAHGHDGTYSAPAAAHPASPFPASGQATLMPFLLSHRLKWRLLMLTQQPCHGRHQRLQQREVHVQPLAVQRVGDLRRCRQRQQAVSGWAAESQLGVQPKAERRGSLMHRGSIAPWIAHRLLSTCTKPPVLPRPRHNPHALQPSAAGPPPPHLTSAGL